MHALGSLLYELAQAGRPPHLSGIGQCVSLGISSIISLARQVTCPADSTRGHERQAQVQRDDCKIDSSCWNPECPTCGARKQHHQLIFTRRCVASTGQPNVVHLGQEGGRGV